MRIYLSGLCGSAIAAAALAGLVGAPSSVQAQEPGFTGGRFLVEGLVLWRSDHDGGLFTDTDPGSGPGIQTDPEDFDPETNGGLRLVAEIPAAVLGGLLPPGYAMQFGAMYAKGFEGDITLDDPNEDTSATYVAALGGIVSPGLDDSDSDQLGAMRMNIATTIAGYESNTLTPAGSVLGGRAFFGTRFIHFSEALDATVFDNFPAGIANDNHLVNIDVNNNMYGAQIGWEGYFNVTSTISIGGRVAGGIFLNRVERDRSFFDQDTPGNAYSDSITETEFSQMLEASPRIMIGLGNNVALTLGGMVLWLNDVSQASPQWQHMLNVEDEDVRADEDVLIYGVTAGVTVQLN